MRKTNYMMMARRVGLLSLLTGFMVLISCIEDPDVIDGPVTEDPIEALTGVWVNENLSVGIEINPDHTIDFLATNFRTGRLVSYLPLLDSIFVSADRFEIDLRNCLNCFCGVQNEGVYTVTTTTLDLNPLLFSRMTFRRADFQEEILDPDPSVFTATLAGAYEYTFENAALSSVYYYSDESITVNYNEDSGDLSFYAFHSDNTCIWSNSFVTRIGFDLADFDGAGVYDLSGNLAYHELYDGDAFSLAYSEAGQLEITLFDASERHMTGEFSFTITEDLPTDLQVQQGSFDVYW